MRIDPMINQKEHTFLVVGAFFRKGDSVLLVRQKKPDDADLKWALPGGYVERGESLLDALHREVWEETGLHDLKIGPLLYAVHLMMPQTSAEIVALVFQIAGWRGQLRPLDSLVDAQETILDARFVPVDEAILCLEQGFRFANEPAIAYLRGLAPQGAVWVYHGYPSQGGDHLIESTPG